MDLQIPAMNQNGGSFGVSYGSRPYGSDELQHGELGCGKVHPVVGVVLGDGSSASALWDHKQNAKCTCMNKQNDMQSSNNTTSHE